MAEEKTRQTLLAFCEVEADEELRGLLSEHLSGRALNKAIAVLKDDVAEALLSREEDWLRKDIMRDAVRAYLHEDMGPEDPSEMGLGPEISALDSLPDGYSGCAVPSFDVFTDSEEGHCYE